MITQVNSAWPSVIDLPRRMVRLSWPGWLVMHQDKLSRTGSWIHGWSPIPVLNGPGVDQLHQCDVTPPEFLLSIAFYWFVNSLSSSIICCHSWPEYVAQQEIRFTDLDRLDVSRHALSSTNGRYVTLRCQHAVDRYREQGKSCNSLNVISFRLQHRTLFLTYKASRKCLRTVSIII